MNYGITATPGPESYRNTVRTAILLASRNRQSLWQAHFFWRRLNLSGGKLAENASHVILAGTAVERIATGEVSNACHQRLQGMLFRYLPTTHYLYRMPGCGRK
jgi:hypothetical protein